MIHLRAMVACALLFCAALAGPVSAQRFLGYAEAVRPMQWQKLEQWIEPLRLSDEQMRMVIHAYDEYLVQASAVEQRFLDGRQAINDAVRDDGLTLLAAVAYKKAKHRNGRDSFNAMKMADELLFTAVNAILADEQTQAMQSVRRHRLRDRYEPVIVLWMDMSGRQFVDLSQLDSVRQQSSEIAPILATYERQLTSLMERLFEEIARRDIEQTEELFAAFGDIKPNRDTRDLQRELMIGEGARDALRLAQRIDELTDETLAAISTQTPTAPALQVDLEYFQVLIMHNLAPRIKSIVRTAELVGDETARLVLNDVLVQFHRSIRETLGGLRELWPRTVDQDHAAFRERNAVRSAKQRELDEAVRKAIGVLGDVTDAGTLAMVKAELGMDEQAVATRNERALRNAGLFTPKQVQMSAAWSRALFKCMDREFDPELFAAYEEEIDRIGERHRFVNSDECRSLILAADESFLESVLRQGDQKMLDILRGLRERQLMLVGKRGPRSLTAIDVVSLLVENGSEWARTEGVLPIVADYGTARSAALRVFLNANPWEDRVERGQALQTIIEANLRLLESLRELLNQEDVTSLLDEYWLRAQPRIVVDQHAASERFETALADADALPEDIRVELAARWMAYRDTYRSLTDEMLHLLRFTASWTRYRFDGSIDGYIPESADGGVDILMAEKVARMYRQRENRSLLEHAYLDTISTD